MCERERDVDRVTERQRYINTTQEETETERQRGREREIRRERERDRKEVSQGDIDKPVNPY